jgi:hypothetical protein
MNIRKTQGHTGHILVTDYWSVRFYPEPVVLCYSLTDMVPFLCSMIIFSVGQFAAENKVTLEKKYFKVDFEQEFH